MNITRRQALIAGSTLAGASMLPGQLRAETKQVSLAFGPVSPVYAIGMIAELKGYFRDEGLDSKLVTGNAGTFGRQTLAAGQDPVRARRCQPSAPAQCARQTLQDPARDRDGVLLRQHRGPAGPLRRRYQFSREARRA
ncbi:hypothetical protein ACVWXQ_008346 [Bradyrhizobium sp. S3.14.4]